MASWLKVAEDLLEVVDRRAKLVANELADEQSDLQATGFNGEEVHDKKTKSKEKGQLKLYSIENLRSNRPKQVERRKELSVPNTKIDRVKSTPYEQSRDVGINDIAETNEGPPSENNISRTSLDLEDSKGELDNTNVDELQLTENVGISTFSTNKDVHIANSEDQSGRSSTPPLAEKELETIDGNHSSDADVKATSVDEETSLTVGLDKPESASKGHSTSNTAENGQEILPEHSSGINKQQEHKTDSFMKVEDQLDEAQGLLKSAVKTGQSKEARLARVCAGLSSRLQEYKTENKQLEELLVAERELNSSYENQIKQLQQDLSASKMEVARDESNMADALAAKNTEIEALAGSLDSLKRQSASSEEKLASLQTEMETIRRTCELTETRMIQALREELASAERRAEEERAAHSATKMAAVEREVELEHQAVEASNALARIQRTADESTSRAAELEHKLALLEVECASLTQELQDMEAHNRRGQKKSSEDASQILQIQAWQEKVERACQGQRDAEDKLSSLEAELQKMRVEMAGMKRDAEHYSRHEHMELEKQYRELTDLLYYKQTQLEAMASEKAALEFQLEKEIKHLQETQLEAERNRAIRRTASSWEEDTDIEVLEPLPLHHRYMAGASIQLQRAAKLLDSGSVRATRFLWRYPIARIILLFYLVFVHLFLMYLLHRLQEQADKFASKEVAASLGLGNSSLP